MNEVILTEIWIYPIKSLGGIRLDHACVRPKGLEFDRRWMLIDDDGAAMTQRTYQEMALFKVEIKNGSISVAYTKGGKIFSSVDFDVLTSASQRQIRAQIWNDLVDVWEVDAEISKWFSFHLNTACRLVRFPEENERPVDPRYSLNNEQVSLADAYPFLIIGQRSLEDLNQRLAQPVPMNRFRPNFVFEGGKPYEEDDWKKFSIGKIPFAAVKKCDRCILPTIDQETAEKGSEPLRTLSTYRKSDNKVNFGQNLVALQAGEVVIGDPIIPA